MTGSEWRDGAVDALPITVAVAPFAAVFGALAVQAGWSVAMVMATSGTIFAGASQYVLLDLHGQGVPAWSVVLAVFVVNFRHVLYSASIGRRMGSFGTAQKALAFFFLVDPQFAASEARSRRRVLRPAYWFGYAAVVYGTWMVFNLIGALSGRLIQAPERYGLDFILPVYFTCLIVGFRGQSGFAGVLVVSAMVALAVHQSLGSPWHMLLGGLAGMVFAAARTPRPSAA